MAKLKTDKSGLVNLASQLTSDDQQKIARELIANYDHDITSRQSWLDKRNRWYKLWLCERDPKSEPWPGASNVCIPMVLTACNQFHARAYQSIFAPPGMVKTLPVEANDIQRAKLVEQFMNWQLLYEMEEYEEEFDMLLLNLPINGTTFKKVYFDALKDRNMAEHVSGVKVVLPYRTKKLLSARWITHQLWLHYQELERRHDAGQYVNFDKVQPEAGKKDETEIRATQDKATGEDQTTAGDHPKLLLEVHRTMKLPGTDMAKPYTLTVDYDSETLLRVTSREISRGGESYILNHFTDYHFLPNPEGFYSFGFGHFLEQLNEMANTAFNQIFDSGRLTNQPFGFYGRRAGFRRQKIKLKPGLMAEVDDATQVVFPNMQRVDQVLFQVLGLIQQSGEHITSTSDYLMGREARGTKTPTAHGTLAIIEQGLVTFGVLTKRVFRQLQKELATLYTLNSIYLPEEKQFRVMGSTELPFPVIKRQDFAGRAKLDVIPIGDPSFASRSIRRQEATELYQIMLTNPLVGLNPQTGQIGNPQTIWQVTSNLLDAYDRKDKDVLLPPMPEPSISPDEEHVRFMQGDAVEPKVGENHQAHLASHLAFQMSPYYASMPPEYQALLQKHVQQTHGLQYLEAQQRAAMQQGMQQAVGPQNLAGVTQNGG